MSERKTIYLCLAHMSEEGLEQEYVKEAFDTNWVVPLGPNVNGFEEDLKNFVGEGKEVVALSAGTAAVHLALLACGVGPGDDYNFLNQNVNSTQFSMFELRENGIHMAMIIMTRLLI